MNENLKHLILKREKWVESSRDNDFEEGLKQILSDLYPDTAHFIYELLQNAEDAKAQNVKFRLFEDRLEFDHDGTKLFSFQDVEAITSIGKSQKSDDHTNIGKFGVGFKSVFAYTSTPEILSGDYHFKIQDLVVPVKDHLSLTKNNNEVTMMSFQFNNEKKNPEKAYSEVEKLLNSLGESTLLFLTNISKIEHSLHNGESGYVCRVNLSNNLINIVTLLPNYDEPSIVTYMRFDKQVEVVDEKGKDRKCTISIAYGVDNTAIQTNTDTRTDINRINLKELEPGRVSIYFPAEKETSKLKFHINAPFASTVARDSVRDCEANKSLRDHIADLVVDSLSFLRDNKLLNVDFLSILPNDDDNLSTFYDPIRLKLIEAFENEDLTPMKNGGYAAARGIFRGSSQLTSLLTDKDLVVILNDDFKPPMWVANAQLKNSRSDDFLTMLDISEYRIDDFISVLDKYPAYIVQWIKEKSDEWHQRLYAILYDYFTGGNPSIIQTRVNIASRLKIIRLYDNTYETGENCFFPDETTEKGNFMKRVKKSVYSSGTNKTQLEKAKSFLIKVGVREVGEVEQLEAYLKKNYMGEGDDFKPKIKDIKRFIRFLKSYPDHKHIFKDIHLMKLEDGVWGKSLNVYLDSPFISTGLKDYYKDLSDKAHLWQLSDEYININVPIDDIKQFAQEIGATSYLVIRKESYTYSQDYKIDYLKDNIKRISLTISKLIWDVFIKYEKEEYYSYFYKHSRRRSNGYWNSDGPSEIIDILQTHPWVPQKTNDNNIVFVNTLDAESKLLPDGFLFDNGWQWLKHVQFGKHVQEIYEQKRKEELERTSEYQQQLNAAKNLGFDSPDIAKKISEAILKDPYGFYQWYNGIIDSEFPEKESPNPDRRSESIADEMEAAETITNEKTTASRRITKDLVQSEAYLRLSYEKMGKLHCQICDKQMPFKKKNGQDYMEKVEILAQKFFHKEHYSRFLSLCPICSAKYQEYVKHDEKQMNRIKELITRGEFQEIPLNLDKETQNATLRFVKDHYEDLKNSILLDKDVYATDDNA